MCIKTNVNMNASSTCDHADALRQVLRGVAAQMGHHILDSFIASYRTLVRTGDLAMPAHVEQVAALRGGRSSWAACAIGIWCALVEPVKSAASQTPRCKKALCASRGRCLHVLAYLEFRRSTGDRGSDKKQEYDEHGVLVVLAQDADMPDEEKADNKATLLCQRNMLLCRGEVDSGRIFNSYGRSGLFTAMGTGSLPAVRHERTCVACGRKRKQRSLVTTDATLHTMGGPISVRTGKWTCKCGKDVKYDGADAALFAYSSKTVFIRIYLHNVLQIALNSRRSLTAATAAMAFCLHVTAGLPINKDGHNTPLINLSTAAYTENPIIPHSTKSCSRCLSSGGTRSYRAVISDGQVLGFFRGKAHAFSRCIVGNPVVDVQLKHGCAVRCSITRAAIRKRCSTHMMKKSILRAREVKAVNALSLAADRGAEGSGRVCDDAACRTRACRQVPCG